MQKQAFYVTFSASFSFIFGRLNVKKFLQQINYMRKINHQASGAGIRTRDLLSMCHLQRKTKKTKNIFLIF